MVFLFSIIAFGEKSASRIPTAQLSAYTISPSLVLFHIPDPSKEKAPTYRILEGSFMLANEVFAKNAASAIPTQPSTT